MTHLHIDEVLIAHQAINVDGELKAANIRHCIICGKELRSRQLKYCRKHAAQVRRQQNSSHKEPQYD